MSGSGSQSVDVRSEVHVFILAPLNPVELDREPSEGSCR